MAIFKSGRQGVGVYLVTPLSRAVLAASLMNAGVSKSGSPAPKPTTSTPAFFSALALAVTARVIESDTSFIRCARTAMWAPGCIRRSAKTIEIGPGGDGTEPRRRPQAAPPRGYRFASGRSVEQPARRFIMIGSRAAAAG